MKKITKIFVTILVVVILSTSFMLCACNNVNKDCKHILTQSYSAYDNPYFTNYFDDESKLNFAEKINSLEELKTFCQEKQFKVFDENDTTLKYDKVSIKLKEYDEEFFQDYSIVLVFRFENTTDYYKFDSVSIKKDVLNINYLSANGSTTTWLRPSISIFELRKKVANKIQQINIQKTLSELDQKANIKIYESNPKTKVDNYATILNSLEDLNNFCNEDTSPYFKRDDSGYSFEPNKFLIEKLKEYDEDFFESNSLVFVSRPRPDSRFYSVKSFNIIDNNLNITLSTPILKDAYPAFIFLRCSYFFEVNKNQISNIKQINVKDIEE